MGFKNNISAFELYYVVGRRFRKISLKVNSKNPKNNINFYFSVKPLTVEIINPPTTLVADRRYEVICESTGSRPNAIITWYKGKRQLRRTKVGIHNFYRFLENAYRQKFHKF